MIVVVIIGILSALAVGRYRLVTEKARIAQANLWCNRIAKAIETMAAETGEYPGHTPAGFYCQWANNEVWDLNSGVGGIFKTDGNYPEWNGPYMTKVPKDPWGSNYAWDSDYYVAEFGGYVAAVVSFGPNKQGKNIYDKDNIIVILAVEDLPAQYYY